MLEKSAIKDLLYGGIAEIVHNREYFYNSRMGSQYNHFTEKGRETVDEFIKTMVDLMLKAEEESLNKRAKDMVINGLKGEKV